ncbi:MAG: amidinotransferase, partial [Pedobacter sp.]
KNKNEKSLLVMSEQAYLSLNEDQILRLEQHCQLLHSPLYTIEKNGGGSARCMLAEIHLPER